MANRIDTTALSGRPRAEDEETLGPPVMPPASEKTNRAAAQQRYDAFLTGDEPPPPPPNCVNPEDYKSFDYDHCPSSTPTAPVLFAKQPADIEEIEPQDVQQEGLGDCYLLASLIGMAGTPDGRAAIKAAVSESTNEQGETVYTVALHKQDATSPTGYAGVSVSVTSPFALGHAAAHSAVPLASAPHEVWPAVVEKAYAWLHGGYNQMARSGRPHEAMPVLTGHPAEQILLAGSRGGIIGTLPGMKPSFAYSAERLKSDLAAQKIIVLTTDERKGLGITPLHAYTVVGTEQRDGTLLVQVRNPLRSPDDPLLLIDFDELPDLFVAITVGSVK